ncbi:peptidoglycan-binding domain-containing protein [Streptomyces longisporoflavus]|uniref:peptidoglycan-binding domain-containing protein n=1 Tax=Streptomyces longisporoflavus TaxID=28044 RepID=UPI001E4E94AE|nr:peptidoglycan-binding domain-containing protein [Streptomyces longisporoflavus]
MSSDEMRSSGAAEGPRCPECGTAREQGGAPACGCTERVADAAREARSADAAAAEDFDPLRIRPYVTLPEPGTGDDAAATEPAAAAAHVLPPEATAPPRSADVGLFAAGGTAKDGPRLSPPPRRHGLPYGDGPPYEDGLPYDEEPEPRRVRIGLFAGVGAVAVITVAVLAAVLLPPDKPQRDDRALPEVPTRAVNAPSGTGTQTATASTPPPATPASPSPDPSTSREASPTPSPSRSASDEARPTRPPSRSTARATESAQSDAPSSGTVLSQGDRGPDVVELQRRLQQLYLYMEEPDGTYDAQVADAVARYQFARGVRKDERGVYGEETRAALEAETSEPREHRPRR